MKPEQVSGIKWTWSWVDATAFQSVFHLCRIISLLFLYISLFLTNITCVNTKISFLDSYLSDLQGFSKACLCHSRNMHVLDQIKSMGKSNIFSLFKDIRLLYIEISVNKRKLSGIMIRSRLNRKDYSAILIPLPYICAFILGSGHKLFN